LGGWGEFRDEREHDLWDHRRDGADVADCAEGCEGACEA
jgi:hypothetical protein